MSDIFISATTNWFLQRAQRQKIASSTDISDCRIRRVNLVIRKYDFVIQSVSIKFPLTLPAQDIA